MDLLIEKNILTADDIIKNFKQFQNSNDFFFDIQEDKYKQLECTMKDNKIDVHILNELPMNL